MAKELGVKVEYVQTSWPNLLKDLQANKFDVAVGGITRNVARLRHLAMLPGYAPTSKVALIRAADKDRFKSLQELDQPSVRVIKNPGGTNEVFVLQHLKNAQVSTHDKNAEIPGMIASGQGDVMITETYEALYYSKTDPRLAIAAIEPPLTPINYVGFLLPTDDVDYLRVMNFDWDLLARRGTLKAIDDKWLH
jgi:cyclohexadienyl dehydratase